MKRTRRQTTWDERVRAAFGSRFATWPRALAYYNGIWTAHLEAGLADGELVSALTGDDECTRRQRIWEMQFAAHLRACGHLPTRRPRGEPDYRIEVGDTAVLGRGDLASSSRPSARRLAGRTRLWVRKQAAREIQNPDRRYQLLPEAVPAGADTDASEGTFEFDAEGLRVESPSTGYFPGGPAR
jgi:hypothetical protein